MERLIINHQRRRNVIKAPFGFQSDHIIPYCICLDDSKGNIQFLTKKEHQIKTVIDHKIIKEFRKSGFIEKITNYSHELLINKELLIEKYKQRYRELVKVDNLDIQPTLSSSTYRVKGNTCLGRLELSNPSLNHKLFRQLTP
jgi:hypothetical protein